MDDASCESLKIVRERYSQCIFFEILSDIPRYREVRTSVKRSRVSLLMIFAYQYLEHITR